VTVVAGATSVDPPANVKVIRAMSAEEMHNAVKGELSNATVFIGAAAVADYAPTNAANAKIKKDGRDVMTLELKKTPDILAEVSKHRHNGLLVVGFAAETNDVADYARSKMEKERPRHGRRKRHHKGRRRIQHRHQHRDDPNERRRDGIATDVEKGTGRENSRSHRGNPQKVMANEVTDITELIADVREQVLYLQALGVESLSADASAIGDGSVTTPAIRSSEIPISNLKTETPEIPKTPTRPAGSRLAALPKLSAPAASHLTSQEALLEAAAGAAGTNRNGRTDPRRHRARLHPVSAARDGPLAGGEQCRQFRY
jgi:hypothetical protein